MTSSCSKTKQEKTLPQHPSVLSIKFKVFTKLHRLKHNLVPALLLRYRSKGAPKIREVRIFPFNSLEKHAEHLVCESLFWESEIQQWI